TDGPEDAGAPRLLLVVDQHGGVLVEADVAAVGATLFLLRAHHHAPDHVALLDVGAGDGVLDGGHEHVPDGRVPAPGPTEDLDTEDLLGSGVVGDAESALLLDHFRSPT